MPPSLRRRAPQHHLPPPEDPDDTDSEVDMERAMGRGRGREEEENGEGIDEELVALEGEDELEDEDALGKFTCSLLGLSRLSYRLLASFGLLSKVSA